MTNIWPSSPSPSLGALPAESSSSSALSVGWYLALTFPRGLWDAYVTSLWYYQPDSWVGRVASTFRILAVVLVLPVVLLTLIDVTSYVIARTLGVVDDVRASTSDVDTTTIVSNTIEADVRRHIAVAVAAPRAVPARLPSTFVSEGPARDSEGLAPEEDLVGGQMSGDGGACGDEGGGGGGQVSEAFVRAVSTAVQAPTQGQSLVQRIQTQSHASDVPSQTYYFTGEENLGLAGEGVFSPAVSMPSSPLTPHSPLRAFTEDGGQVSEDEGIALRRRMRSMQEGKLVDI